MIQKWIRTFNLSFNKWQKFRVTLRKYFLKSCVDISGFSIIGKQLISDSEFELFPTINQKLTISCWWIRDATLAEKSIDSMLFARNSSQLVFKARYRKVFEFNFWCLDVHAKYQCDAWAYLSMPSISMLYRSMVDGDVLRIYAWKCVLQYSDKDTFSSNWIFWQPEKCVVFYALKMMAFPCQPQFCVDELNTERPNICVTHF